ncbi:hypothetical protein [Streptomyces iranensis]|uniref:Peptidase S8/S53 subtilisin kexin sedolisin n=1 Tax=Streptomyces iranensis TaxID=576784 RepID=A0A060ZP70_9ACTN|nr:hypothetical protein [Streptomyces iranensis]MBP2062823.1 hypothetical protein [Streptomyces iranensis]CDR04805.1 peptidase S8/S53 subtilisin kexin sedolisin [Streptomyces iranensis]
MWYRRIRRTAARGAGARGARVLATGCALAALGLAAGPAPGALAAPAEGTPTAVTSPVPDAMAHTVTLVTGERVTLGADGSVVVAPRPGAEADYVTRRLDNDVFVIPLTALPYLGRALDPALFNVSALAEAGVTTTPVRVEATGGATAPRSGPAFGAALAKQVGAEAAEGSAGDGPLFGGVTSVVPAVATADGRAAPRPPARADDTRADFTRADHTRADHPVKVTVLGTDGKPLPGTTPFALANVDDAARYREPSLQAVDGEAKAEVPAGRYSAMVSAPTFDGAGESTGIRMATAEFTVPDGATGTDVVLDLRKATERVTFSTPRPAEEHQLILHYLRDDAKGEVAVNGGVGVSSGAPVYVQPSNRPVTTGDLRFNVYTHRKAPADAAMPYSYDLKLANPAGVIAKNQHYKVTGRQLTTVRTNYHSDTPGRAQEIARLMYLPYESSGEALSEPFKAPAQRIEYVGGSPGASYQGWLKAGERRFVSEKQTLRPGRTTAVDWLRGPLAPGFTEPARGAAAEETWYCAACRKGDALTFSLATVMDSAGHHVLAFPSDITSSHFAVVSGDTTLYEGDGVSGGVLTVPPRTAPYRVVYDQTRTNGEFHQSLTTHTEWTFSSGHSGAQTVPDNWTCVSEAGEYDGPAECSALPVVVPHYRLDAALDGTSPAGDDHLVVGFGHVPGVAGTPAVTKARVEVSFDGGERWTAAAITALGKGRFRADWTTPDAAVGRDASLRVTGTDADGNTVAQTVKSAFTVAAARGQGVSAGS